MLTIAREVLLMEDDLYIYKNKKKEQFFLKGSYCLFFFFVLSIILFYSVYLIEQKDSIIFISLVIIFCIAWVFFMALALWSPKYPPRKGPVVINVIVVIFALSFLFNALRANPVAIILSLIASLFFWIVFFYIFFTYVLIIMREEGHDI